MVLITTANFRSGGKSSIARLLAEKLNTTILNFDKKRDSEAYNVVSTINIPENKSIERKEDCLILRDKTTEQTIKTKSNYLICVKFQIMFPLVSHLCFHFFKQVSRV